MLVYPDENAMKQAIAEKIALIHIEEILAAINQFPARMDACLLAEGGHFNPNQQNWIIRSAQHIIHSELIFSACSPSLKIASIPFSSQQLRPIERFWAHLKRKV